jgi:uncharacterized membrane protein YphA (DoxX/SURF4 family)
VDDLAQIAALALAACFVWAGSAKLLRPRRWRESLRSYGPPALTGVAAASVPVAELAVAALLIANGRAGAVAAAILLALFTGALLRARERVGDKVPCACFGSASQRDWRALGARNALLMTVAVVAFSAERPVGGETVAIVLAITGLALAVWTAAATRAALRR